MLEVKANLGKRHADLSTSRQLHASGVSVAMSRYCTRVSASISGTCLLYLLHVGIV